MDTINNNQFEVKPTSKSKRKVVTPCPNVYLNPALDLLANEDPMCNTAMEIVPKKRKRTRSLDISAFENSALDVGISKTAVNEFLVRELENVRKNVRPFGCTDNVTEDLEPKNNISEVLQTNLDTTEPIYANLTESSELQQCSVSDTTLNHSVNDLPAVPTRNRTISKSVPEDISDISSITHSNIPVTDMPVLPICNAMPVITDISFIPQNTVPNTSIDFSVNDMATLSNQDLDINNAMVLENDVDISKSEEFPLNDMPTLPIRNTDLCNMVALENGMEVSRIDDVNTDVDSGISILEQKSLNMGSVENETALSAINNTTNIQTTNQIFINNTSNLSLSFIDRLALDSPNLSNKSLILDDDLNESNIMEIKTITIITKKRQIPIKKAEKKNTNPFLDPNLKEQLNSDIENPFLIENETQTEMEYNDEVINRPVQVQINQANNIQPRKLFASDTNSTISTVNESVNTDQNEYDNIDDYRSESPIYENVNEMEANYNKQSKILGYDVSQLTAVDIMNLNKNSQANYSNESNESKRDLKHQIMKASNKLSKKVFKKLKKTFRTEKHDQNATVNPYEVPRKLPKKKTGSKDTGIENPCLNLDFSDDDIEIEELDDDNDEEHQYETIKTMRNTRLNMNVTPLREKTVDNVDISHNKTNTPGKKVRFDSTLNKEKIITGNSFDYGIQSPGFDAKIDKYHDELENCINERKFLQQNMD